MLNAERSAARIRLEYTPLGEISALPDLEPYREGAELEEQYHREVLDAIERERRQREHE